MGVAASRERYTATLALGMGLAVPPTTSSTDMDTPTKRKRDPSTINPNPSTLPTITTTPVDTDDDLLVPTIFSWNFGGQHVLISGAWDNWAMKTTMYKNASNHIALLYLPCGEYHFKFFVDDNWQCAPNLPTRTDEHGNTNNIITIIPEHLEFDSSAPVDLQAPPSPLTSYDQASTAEFSSDPPILPPHLEARSLKPLPEDISPQVTNPHTHALQRAVHRLQQTSPHLMAGPPVPLPPERPFFSHVFIDHMYQAKRQAPDDDVLYLSQTSRVSGKIINTVYITNHFRLNAPASEHKPAFTRHAPI